MKQSRSLAMLLACLMLAAMAGCGGTTSQPQQEAQPAATQAAPVSHAEADAVNAAIKQGKIQKWVVT